jgi:dUTP pyrophosphatase
MTTTLKVKLLTADAKPPQQAHPTDAGYDLFANESVTIHPHTWLPIDTGIAFTVPTGTYGRVAPRSGLSLKGIDVLAGVVDQAYTGPVKVVLINHADTPFTVNKNDRIAQLILEQIKIVPIEVVDNLTPTSRGDGGFGSTGVAAT